MESSRSGASWIPADPGPLRPGLALAYGGIAQLLAGMWEFRTGNTFGAVAFSSFGAFWISYWALVTFFVDSIPASHAGAAIGLYLWAWAIFTTYMFVASLRTTGAVALVFFLLAITFILLGAGNAGDHTNVIKWGGYVGLATAIAAWYDIRRGHQLDVRPDHRTGHAAAGRKGRGGGPGRTLGVMQQAGGGAARRRRQSRPFGADRARSRLKKRHRT